MSNLQSNRMVGARMFRRLIPVLVLSFGFALAAFGQQAVSVVSPPVDQAVRELSALPGGQKNPGEPAAVPALILPTVKTGTESGIAPTWETQSTARTFFLSIPAPRGQIVDREGNPLAQTKVAYTLNLNFPTPTTWPDKTVLSFARDRIRFSEDLLGRSISLTDAFIIKHYRNRGSLPLELTGPLKDDEIARVQARNDKWLTLRPSYIRYYPNGQLAGPVIGYASKAGRALDTPVQNNDPVFPESAGREGIEQAYNMQLTGKAGQMNINFDATGKKTVDKIVIPPQPGSNVVTALSLRIQTLCEQILAKSCKRGAIVVMDPNTGDILALASWPSYDPNLFVPSISVADFKRLNDDPDIPLLPRAFRSAYPPGSVFKTFVGMAALESNTVKPDTTFDCPSVLTIGRIPFRNWKKSDAGSLTFAEALTQSCNTWFYQVGIKTGSAPINEWCAKLGLGQKTGIPLYGEAPGRVTNDEYMKKIYGRKMLDGDLANLAIGQGDTLISPLQMATAMAAVGNGGTVFQPRLVLQVQTFDNRIMTGYPPRAKEFLTLRESTVKALKEGLVGVVESGMGTAGQAAVPKVKVAGKTGTAQWGPKTKERTAAWFAGFAPADQPKYAFAAVYEGSVGDSDVHGGTHAAPMIGKVLRELFKDEVTSKKGKKKKADEATEEETEPKDPERQKEIERQAKDEE